MQTIFINLSDAWPQIKSADLLLWRGNGLLSNTIAGFGRGVHKHASTVAMWGDDLMVIDTHWRRGGDVRLLANDVKKYSGTIDWFEANAINDLSYDRDGVVSYMRRLVDTSYGFRNIFHAFKHHVPIVRDFVNPEINDDETCTFPPFCSDARSRADRIGGGCDPVPFSPDRLTEPSDLARSGFYKYRGTLVYDGQDKAPLPTKPRPMFSFSLAS